MRQVHRAGEKTFIDFSGKRPALIDRQTRGAEAGRAAGRPVLGASGFTYAEAPRPPPPARRGAARSRSRSSTAAFASGSSTNPEWSPTPTSSTAVAALAGARPSRGAPRGSGQRPQRRAGRTTGPGGSSQSPTPSGHSSRTSTGPSATWNGPAAATSPRRTFGAELQSCPAGLSCLNGSPIAGDRGAGLGGSPPRRPGRCGSPMRTGPLTPRWLRRTVGSQTSPTMLGRELLALNRGTAGV